MSVRFTGLPSSASGNLSGLRELVSHAWSARRGQSQLDEERRAIQIYSIRARWRETAAVLHLWLLLRTVLE